MTEQVATVFLKTKRELSKCHTSSKKSNRELGSSSPVNNKRIVCPMIYYIDTAYKGKTSGQELHLKENKM